MSQESVNQVQSQVKKLKEIIAKQEKEIIGANRNRNFDEFFGTIISLPRSLKISKNDCNSGGPTR